MRSRGLALALAVLALPVVASCRTAYVAPPARTAATPTSLLDRGAADPGDMNGVAIEEASCRTTLQSQTVVASLAAIDAVAEALGSVCTLAPVQDDPLLWRVWCRSDALFQSGHYLRSSTDPFDCRGAPTSSAFACAGKLLAERLIAPGYTDRVEVLSVGHVDRQRLATDAAFIGEPCAALQARFSVAQENRWSAPAAPGAASTPAAPAASTDIAVWNDRLAWCRAAYAAGEVLSGLGPTRAVDVGVVGAATSWLDARRACPDGRRGDAPGACTAARRVDVLVRFVPAARAAGRACEPSPAVAERSAQRALYCYEDCAVARDVGRVRQRYVVGRSSYALFAPTQAAAGEHWLVQRMPGATLAPVNVGALRAILQLGD